MIWLKGLLAAAVSGAASAAGSMVLDPDHFNAANPKHLGLIAAIGAVMGVGGYLKQSPLPPTAPDAVSDAKRATLPVLLLVGLSAGLLASCATFPPRNPDGSLNVKALIDDASYGIEADCALGFNLDVCTFGRATIDAARAVQANDQAALLKAVRQSLVDSVAKWPVINPYVSWFIALLPAA